MQPCNFLSVTAGFGLYWRLQRAGEIMSRLVRVASWKGKWRATVVFVHGLGGHAYKTWRRGKDDDTFWPVWLAEDVEGISVYSLSYEAPVSNWLGTSMPLQDRAS